MPIPAAGTIDAIRARAGAFPGALAVFFLSGFAALLYQVIWQRLLVIFSGADVYSVTIIVAAFMTGLGLGSLVGGRLADRLGPGTSLWAFAAAELCVGLFGLVSKTLYYDVLYTQFPHLAATPALAAVVLLASLLWPTFFMGLSLPLLARALTDTLGLSGRVIGSLYGFNTLGAATGAFVGTWVLIPRLGLEASLWVAATASLACAAAAMGLGWRGVAATAPLPGLVEHRNPVAPAESERLSFPTWVAIYGLTGFIALAFEITWFRMLGVILKSTAFTFGTLLAVYLSGLGLGAAVAAGRAGRSSRPGATFLMLQCGVALYAALTTAMLARLIAAGHPVKLVRYLGGYEPVDVATVLSALGGASDGRTAFLDFAILYLVVPAVIIGPPTLLMGASFPYLQQASQSTFSSLGRRLGVLLAANIAGSALGAMVTGWLLLSRLGTATTLRLLVVLGMLLAVPLVRGPWPRGSWAVVGAPVSALLITIAAIAAMPDALTLWARLHAASPHQVIVAEDGAGLSLLKAEGTSLSGQVGVYVNGLGQSWIPYGNVHTVLGALPVMIHPSPKSVVVIGLGSGDTAFAAAGRAGVERLTSVEIIGVQRETLRRLAVIQRYPGLVALLSDPRVEHRVGDGRAYLRQTDRRFDIIEADALRPGSAYSGNLYSREYFELVRARLATGGLAVTWAPTERIRRTFTNVFPHVLACQDIYLGSDAPIRFDRGVLEARMSEARRYFEAAGVDLMAVMGPYLESAVRIGPETERATDDLNTDTFPRDEFALPF